MITVGIPRALLFYYNKDLWNAFFKKLNVKTIMSDVTNKKIMEDGDHVSIDEACLSLKIFLGHIENLRGKCDYILVPRLYSIKKNEQVCTNFNCLYDLVHNLYPNVPLISYNVDLTKNSGEMVAFLKMGNKLGFSYIETLRAYRYAKNEASIKRTIKEQEQERLLQTSKTKILFAGHPYNLYDPMIGKTIRDYLKKEKMVTFYSDLIHQNIIDTECEKLSTDIHWTHSKEVMASISYYHEKVDGIILISSFPCGPDSLANELVIRKINNIPILNIVVEDINSDVGILTRLESFFDILKQKKEMEHEKSN